VSKRCYGASPYMPSFHVLAQLSSASKGARKLDHCAHR
jgi:hypothetical protein